MNDNPLTPAAGSQIELKDIHLPEPISWWPPAPGWWLLLLAMVIIIFGVLIARKIYKSRQLKRDIAAELDHIKQQYQNTQDKSQLAKALSILLRRVSITCNPTANAAGLTGDSWLVWLDDTHYKAGSGSLKVHSFQSETGKILLSAPYLPEEAELDFDSEKLIALCESWLSTAHSSKRVQAIKVPVQK